jgi:inner membrane protein involved in colicin E2 resistance
VADAIPVALLAGAAVVLVVLGGTMVSTIRGFLRAF